MDRETKDAFSGVNSRLDKLDGRFSGVNSGLDKLDGRVDKLEASLTRAAGLLNTLAGEVQHLAQAQQRTETTVQQLSLDVRQLGARLDNFAEQVMRGFTKRDEDHAALEARVTKLES